MDRSFAEELYPGSLQQPKSDPISGSVPNDGGDVWGEDDFEFESRSRYRHFVTIGYRDGVIAGQEASAQEGFNVGFKQSVLTGFNWGLVRGITSALAFLPDNLRQKMIETQDTRDKFHCLHESVHSLSSSDAFNSFGDDISSGKINLSSEETEGSLNQSNDQSLESSRIGGYIGELKSLLLESPKIDRAYTGELKSLLLESPKIETHLDASSASSMQ